MPTSKSKRTARVASFGALPAHPAVAKPDPLLEYRLGATNPLRLPDTANAPSAATVLKSEYTLGSDAAGHLAFAENFSTKSSRVAWTVTAGVLGAPSYTDHPQLTAFVAEARTARMVAMRVTVLYIGVEQEAAGYLSFQEKAATSDISLAAMDSLHTGADAQVKATDGLVVYTDFTQTPRWEDPNTNAFMQYTFPLAGFFASGLPASKASLFRVKVERFMEYLPVEGALSEGELLHEPSNPAALSAHGELSGPSTSIHKPADLRGFLSAVKGVANAAYHIAQPLLPYVVPKARSYLMGALKMGVPALLM